MAFEVTDSSWRFSRNHIQQQIIKFLKDVYYKTLWKQKKCSINPMPLFFYVLQKSVYTKKKILLLLLQKFILYFTFKCAHFTYNSRTIAKKKKTNV